MNEMIKAAFENKDALKALGESMANSIFAASRQPSYGRLMVEAKKEWDAMTPEQKERRRKTHEVQGRSLPEAERHLHLLARARLRPDFKPIDMEWGLFQQFQDLGITNLRTAKDWARAQHRTAEVWDAFCVFGTRDMAWQLSWWIEVLEGRYPEDVANQYGGGPYLRCRYGIEIADFIHGYGE